MKRCQGPGPCSNEAMQFSPFCEIHQPTVKLTTGGDIGPAVVRNGAAGGADDGGYPNLLAATQNALAWFEALDTASQPDTAPAADAIDAGGGSFGGGGSSGDY